MRNTHFHPHPTVLNWQPCIWPCLSIYHSFKNIPLHIYSPFLFFSSFYSRSIPDFAVYRSESGTWVSRCTYKRGRNNTPSGWRSIETNENLVLRNHKVIKQDQNLSDWLWPTLNDSKIKFVKSITDRQTDRPTNQPTNRPTNRQNGQTKCDDLLPVL